MCLGGCKQLADVPLVEIQRLKSQLGNRLSKRKTQIARGKTMQTKQLEWKQTETDLWSTQYDNQVFYLEKRQDNLDRLFSRTETDGILGLDDNIKMAKNISIAEATDIVAGLLWPPTENESDEPEINMDYVAYKNVN